MENSTPPITDVLGYLHRKLREVGPQAWPDIASETGCSKNMLRKIAYNDAQNPGVSLIQPVVTYFWNRDQQTPRRRASDKIRPGSNGAHASR